MKMSQQDVDAYLWSLPRTVAKELGIQDFDFLSSEELGDEIFKKSPDVFVKLNEFVKIYIEWYQFQIDKDEEIEKARLSSTDFEVNMALIKKRDDARQILIQAVRQP